MVRKIYDGYDYIDPDNLYTYPHSSVLINKFNEKNDNKARELEYRLVASQSLKLFVNPIEVNTVSDILKIHKFLDSKVWPSLRESYVHGASAATLFVQHLFQVS